MALQRKYKANSLGRRPHKCSARPTCQLEHLLIWSAPLMDHGRPPQKKYPPTLVDHGRRPQKIYGFVGESRGFQALLDEENPGVQGHSGFRLLMQCWRIWSLSSLELLN